MMVHIKIKLFASLKRFVPAASENFPIESGITVKKLLEALGVPEDEIKLVFIDGAKRDLNSTLNGGERVGIFPAVGGG
jgi:molybdopterin converting factor small subunit